MPNRLSEIREAAGGRPIAWFGTRGVDALTLACVGNLSFVVSQIAPASAEGPSIFNEDCLETRINERLDLDRYDIDSDFRREARSLRTTFLELARPPLIVVAYRSAEFLSAASFCDDGLLTAFNFHLFQRQFEHKPFVERALRRWAPDLPILPTRYVRDTDLDAVERSTQKGPQVGRTSTGSGGTGVFLFANKAEFVERLQEHRDGFVAVAPFLSDATPLNINACVYRDGVSVFGVSYQLIGVDGLTARRFGFCGNDFAASLDLEASDLREIERITAHIGEWLKGQGYLGIYGLDLLLGQDGCVVTELNPRFQASTPLSSSINQALELPDPATEHLAAFMGLPKPNMPDCVEQARLVRALIGSCPVAQAIHRNILLDPVKLDNKPEPSPKTGDSVECVASPRTYIANEAMMFRSMHVRQVTHDGFTVTPDIMRLNESARRGF